MATLSKTRTLMDLVGDDGAGAVTFAPTEGRAHWLKVDADVFEDMGRPEQITVTIEPGDLLNVEQKED